MVLNQLLVKRNNSYNFENYLPLLTFISVVGIFFGLVFTFYFLYINFNLIFSIINVLFLIIGIIAGFFTEVITRRIEKVQNVKW
mgnify:CR=1 FL=1